MRKKISVGLALVAAIVVFGWIARPSDDGFPMMWSKNHVSDFGTAAIVPRTTFQLPADVAECVTFAVRGEIEDALPVVVAPPPGETVYGIAFVVLTMVHQTIWLQHHGRDWGEFPRECGPVPPPRFTAVRYVAPGKPLLSSMDAP